MNSILFAIALLFAQASGSSVEGLIVREGSNEPIRGAEVRLGVGAGGSSARTDESGRFKFLNVPPGTYGVAATHSEYMPGVFGQRGPNRPGRQISVASGQDAKDIVVRLTPRGTVFGRVLTKEGQPAINAAVQLLRYLYIDGQRMLAIDKETKTNDAGEYRFPNVAPLEYAVSAEARPPQTPSYLRGTAVYFPGTVDPDSAATINVLPGSEYGGLDVTLIERDAVSIRGHVVDMAGAIIPRSFFLTLAPRDRRTLIAGETAPRNIKVAADGSFVVEGVAPGFYDFIATVGDGAGRHSTRLPLNIRSDISDLKVELQQGFEVRGNVVLEGAPGADLSDVNVQLLHQPYITQVSPGRIQAQPDGSFVFSGVMPGDYRLVVATKKSFSVVFARLGGQDILNAPVRMDSGGNLLDIHLKPNDSSLDINVVDDRNMPADGVQVALVPDVTRRARLEIYDTASTDSSGSTSLKNIEPGSYRVFAWDYLDAGKWQDPDFISRTEYLGTIVRIGENAHERVTLRVLTSPR